MNDRVLGGRFHLDRLLGRGGMAEVYAAYDANLDRQVAIKVLLPRFNDDESFQERFTEEGRRAAGLNHPNVVTVLDTGLDQETDLRFIVMEMVHGRSLQETIKAGGLTEQRALEVCADVCSALQYAHDRGLVHRDIKPGNILMADDGTVKVTDFGIARAIDSDSNVTQTAAVLGTAAYLSPEQAQGRPVDARSDVYALGVVLYELLTGQQPFQGDTAVTVAYQHVQELARPPRDLNPGLSTPAEAICVRAMAKNPANRYQSAAELREDLLRALSGGDVAAPAVLRATETALLDPVDPTSTTGVRTQRRRRALGYTLLGVGSVLAAALAVFLLLQSFGDDGGASRTVPDVTRRSAAEANQQLELFGLRGSVTDLEASADVPEGQVTRQSPAAGTDVPEGATVQLWLSSGPPEVTIPEIVGLEEAEAVAALRQADLIPGERTKVFDDEAPVGTVIGSTPSPGTRVGAQTRVDLQISAGEELVRVPSVRFQTEAEARLTLKDLGLEVLVVQEFNDTVDPGVVADQDPPPSTEVKVGSEVTLVVSRGPEETEEPSPTPTQEPSPTPSPTPPPPSPTPTETAS